MEREVAVADKDEQPEKKCGAGNGDGGAWVQPTDVSGNGKRQPGKQTWAICRSCGGNGTV